MSSSERVLMCPHEVRHVGALPLIEGPLCPYDSSELDLVGVDVVVQGSGVTVETPTALACASCNYRFRLTPTTAPPALAAAGEG